MSVNRGPRTKRWSAFLGMTVIKYGRIPTARLLYLMWNLYMIVSEMPARAWQTKHWPLCLLRFKPLPSFLWIRTMLCLFGLRLQTKYLVVLPRIK